MYDTILVPLDGSAFAEQVLPLAALVARRSGMTIELVTVHHARALGYAEGSLLGALDVASGARAISNEYLDRVAARVSRDARVRVCRRLLDDPAATADAICAEAVRIGAAMIAMTTHGRTGILRAVRGSVADGVLKHASVPVLLWRADDATHGTPTPPTRVLAALDGSTWAESVLPAAAALASMLEARLSLLQVVAPVPAMVCELVGVGAEVSFAAGGYEAPVVDDIATRRIADRATAYMQRMLGRIRLEHPELVVDAYVVTDDRAAEAVARTARELGADLVAMTTHGRGASRFLVGSTVDGVLSARGGATLVIHPTAPNARR